MTLATLPLRSVGQRAPSGVRALPIANYFALSIHSTQEDSEGFCVDYLSSYNFLELRSFEDWNEALSNNVPTGDMLEWFGSVLDGLLETREFKPWTLNQWCAAQHRFRELGHFSRKLTPEQRKTFIDEADMILGLIREFYGSDQAAMARLDAALAAGADYNKRFGWPSPVWEILDFDEL
jgi:hypothetical protein